MYNVERHLQQAIEFWPIAFGVYTVDLLNQKKFDRMVAWKNRKVIDVPIDEGIKTYKNVERKDSLVETALSLDIYIGDDV